MLIFKPQRGSILVPGHELTAGLAGCWLMNETAGNTVCDLSGNRNIGTLQAAAVFGPAKFGSGIVLDGTEDNGVIFPVTNQSTRLTGSMSAFGWFRFDVDNKRQDLINFQCAGGLPDTEIYNSLYELVYVNISGYKLVVFWEYGAGTNEIAIQYSWTPTIGKWYHIGFVRTAGATSAVALYIDGVQVDSVSGRPNATGGENSYLQLGTSDAVAASGMDGCIDHVAIWNRALSAAEIAGLAREPFCMFDEGIRSAMICNPPAIISLEGTAGIKSSAQGDLVTFYKLPELERFWLRDALYNGMTANAFKLGTVLSLGWLWFRENGCTALYRGSSMENIDFDNILAVSEPDSAEINPPSFIPHNANSKYFYIVRKFNRCGLQEHTLAASAKVSIKEDGSLKEREPNKVFVFRAKQIAGNKVKIIWFYCSLEQQSQPLCFKVYYDNASGLIDYENPLAEIEYKGLKFYSYESSTLQAGCYLFAVSAESSDGVDNDSPAKFKIELVSGNPEPIDILETKTI